MSATVDQDFCKLHSPSSGVVSGKIEARIAWSKSISIHSGLGVIIIGACTTDDGSSEGCTGCGELGAGL